MVDPLEPYQIAGARFLASRHRAGLFDEPGLGKTAQAIRAHELLRAERTLVICPAGVRQVWPQQVRLWSRVNLKVVKADSIFDAVAWARGRCDMLIVSFEQAKMWQAELTGDFFDVLIVDESHYMKNPEAQRTKAVQKIAQWAAHVWFLSGTPIKNDPADLWIPLRMADATKLSFTAFQQRYFRQRVGTFSISNSVRPEALPELRNIIQSMSVMRTFDDVGEQLPLIRLDLLGVDGAREELVNYLRQYPGLDKRILDVIEQNAALSFDDSTHVATLRALIAQAKAPGYARLIVDELKSGTIDKLVVMAHHRAAIRIVCDHLTKHGIRAEEITGATSEFNRTRIVESFQSDPKGVRVIVGNIQAAGTGLTMTAACRLDMLESSWTPADNVQAVRRIRRKGQARPTLVRFVSLEDSFDQVVSTIVQRKANTIVSITTKDNLQEAMAS